ncbi:Fc receptor-like protein 5, partial [Clarias magur]
KPKPTVKVNPQSSIYTGDRVTLSCDLPSTGWTFIWHSYQQLKYLASVETHSNTLDVTGSNVGETTYYCKPRRGNYESDYSNAAKITVRVRPQPVVKVQPAESVFIGESVTLICEVQTGGSWQYHWYRDNKELSDAAGKKTYTITDVKESNKGDYTCKETKSSDPKYTQTSAAVTLTVSENPKPELTSDLKGAALIGNPVTLSCTLKLQSTGWKFYWIKDTQSNETETETFHYFIRSVSVSDGGQYRCRAGRGNPVYYTHYSDALWVNVTDESPPVSLIISPSRTQHFTADSLSLSCEDQRDSTGWTVRGYTHSETLFDCSSVSGSTCNISSLSTSHTGVYWCQSESGGRSHSLNITVHNGDVILESPVHPVTDGNPLTLRCLYRKTKISDSGFEFYKDDSVLQKQTTGKMTISRVSKSDEGFYHCKHPERGESPKSWVSVRVSASGLSGVIIGLSLTLMFVILMILLILLLCYKKKKECVEYQTPAVNQPTDGDNVYENIDVTTTAGANSMIHSHIGTGEKKHNDGDNIYENIDIRTTAGANNMIHSHIGTKENKHNAGANNMIHSHIRTGEKKHNENTKPELTSDLKGAALTGTSVTLTCTLKLQSAGWTFYWIKETQSTETETFHYFIRSVKVSDGGQYRCRAGRGNPVYYTHYSDALYVTGKSPMSLIISPSRTQHFTADSLSLSCEDQRDSTGWTVRRYTHSETLYNCSSVSGSTCNISSLSTSHTGVYWCQSESGGRSHSLNITVH